MPEETAQPANSRKQRLTSFGGYEIEGELGRGGMGVVYRARQIKLNRIVALKMLTGHYGSDELQRFLAEAETAAGLQHTNIAHIYEVGEHEGAPFYSLEYVEGGTLADHLRKQMPTPHQAAQLLIQIARALHFAHQSGVVHRDMKPANILLDPDGIPKVTDFGIAKRLKQDTNLTVSGAVIGTPTYMAPEQAKGSSRHVGPAADIYSLGAILYEMLAGRPPFLPEENETAITVRILTEDPVSPAWHRPETPRDLEVICMKCLEKEPRDRYQSAAAFAEDLRRFLDDETIIARPPTTAVRTVKWIRRHPWKSVGWATAILLLVGSLWQLGQWELYQRPHPEYAIGIDYRFGGPEPLAVISVADAKRRASSLRFTRRGRWGRVTRVESINARGFPANVSQFFDYDPLPNWIEGGFGLHEAARKTREATSIEFLYDNQATREAIARDCNGTLTWHVIYDQPTPGHPKKMHARYVTSRGFDFASREGASVIEFERDDAGRDIKATFFNGSGQPAANSEGAFGYLIQRNPNGQIVKLVSLGKDGNPAPNMGGQVGFAFTLDPRGLTTRTEFRDEQDRPATLHGIAALTTDYDAVGNAVRVTRLSPEGKPVKSQKDDWSVQEMTRNERGEIIEQRYLAAEEAGKLSPKSKRTIAYDANGFPNDISFTGPANWRTAMKFDDRGNVLEEMVLGPDGKPAPGPEGWAIHRHAWQFSADGSSEEETWFNPEGKVAYNPAGAHRRLSEFDAAGNLHRLTTSEHDPARFRYQRYLCEPEYDAEGRLRRNIVKFQTAGGKPATDAGLAYTAQEVVFDEQEREILDWKLDCAPEIGAASLRTETEWQRTGARKRVVRQACDAKRNPVAVLPNGNAAHVEREFDSLDKLERIYETGFNEKIVGFSQREAKFNSGKLESVVHTRSNGSLVEQVRVVIISVTPEQPKAAELQVGDQLIAANDRPVTSAYAWVASGPFSGGWIEVLRHGERIRIDGFKEGALGIALEDRAADAAP